MFPISGGISGRTNQFRGDSDSVTKLGSVQEGSVALEKLWIGDMDRAVLFPFLPLPPDDGTIDVVPEISWLGSNGPLKWPASLYESSKLRPSPNMEALSSFGKARSLFEARKVKVGQHYRSK